MSKQVPRLKDIAREAEVSLTTASIILRHGRGRFQEETRERVFSVARKLGWRQNLLVQGMQTGKTNTIGVLVPPFDSYWTNVLLGIHRELVSADYMPITLWTGEDMQDDSHRKQVGQEQIERLIDRRVEGLIIWPDFAENHADYFRELVSRHIPLVVIDHELSPVGIADSVQTDEEQGARLVAEHLLELGHRRIACLTEWEKNARSWQERRRKSFEGALGRCVDAECQTYHMSSDDSDGKEVAMQVLQRSDRPTAFFGDTDHVAVDIYNAASELGIAIPNELSVVGFSDLDFTLRMRPPLTTVRQKSIEVGRRAGALVIGRVRGEIEGPSKVERVGCELVVRHSTQALKGV